MVVNREINTVAISFLFYLLLALKGSYYEHSTNAKRDGLISTNTQDSRSPQLQPPAPNTKLRSPTSPNDYVLRCGVLRSYSATQPPLCLLAISPSINMAALLIDGEAPYYTPDTSREPQLFSKKKDRHMNTSFFSCRAPCLMRLAHESAAEVGT